MEHYFGSQAICERIGAKHNKTLYRLIAVEAFPAYKRTHRAKNGKNQVMLYSNEAMILSWELTQAASYRERQYGNRPLPRYIRYDSDRPNAPSVRERKCTCTCHAHTYVS